MAKSKLVTEKELNAYKKKHMKYHHEEEKEDLKKDKKLIKTALRKAKIAKRK